MRQNACTHALRLGAHGIRLSLGGLRRRYKDMNLHAPEPETVIDRLGGWICAYVQLAPKARNASLALIHRRRIRA